MDTRTNSCPCCSGPLLRHARHSGVYWFCTSCWQEVPLLAISKMPRLRLPNSGNAPSLNFEFIDGEEVLTKESRGAELHV